MGVVFCSWAGLVPSQPVGRTDDGLFVLTVSGERADVRGKQEVEGRLCVLLFVWPRPWPRLLRPVCSSGQPAPPDRLPWALAPPLRAAQVLEVPPSPLVLPVLPSLRLVLRRSAPPVSREEASSLASPDG